jgi:uncharacterized protein (TIGR00661 family)
MRILYGVVGEGMGHAMRSRVVLEHLLGAGHEVEIMASGRAAEFLRKRFADRSWVHRIHGLHIVYEDNRVRKGSTLWTNVLAGVSAVPRQIAAYFELIAAFKAQLVISDFESWTYHYAKMHGLPVLSIDNMQILNRCEIDPEVVEDHKKDFEISKAFVKSKLPFCDHYLVTTFFQPPLRKPDTTLFPPILRPEILAAERSDGEHLLVYQTAEGQTSLLDALRKSGLECRVYGARRNLKQEVVEGNLRFRSFSETGFIEDLASARGVIAGGGFTLMGEAVFLRKPMLSVPIGGQFEQVLNGKYLQRLGYGRFAESLDDPSPVQQFIQAIPSCQEQLASYSQAGNMELLCAVDQHLQRLG